MPMPNPDVATITGARPDMNASCAAFFAPFPSLPWYSAAGTPARLSAPWIRSASEIVTQ